MSRLNKLDEYASYDVLKEAYNDDTYCKGEADFSTTEILKPPQLTFLASKHEPRDLGAWQSWSAFIGTVIHDYLENSARKHFPNALIEERLYKEFEIDGETVKLGGKVDIVFPGVLIKDYKVIFESQCPDKMKSDHEAQNNYNAILLHENGVTVTHGQIEYIAKDWRPNSFRKTIPEPRRAITKPLLDKDKVTTSLVRRLTEHVRAKKGLPTRSCTDEERWMKPNQWALGKVGFKRARKVCHSQKEADENKKPGEVIEFRQGEYTRCEKWCSFSHVCSQFNKK